MRDATCGLMACKFDDDIGGERVAAAVGGVEVARVGGAEGAHQGIDLVRIPEVEGRVLHQGAHARRGAVQARGGLHVEPLVDDQRLVLPLGVEGVERGLPLGQVEIGEDAERGADVGHVAAPSAANCAIRRGSAACWSASAR